MNNHIQLVLKSSTTELPLNDREYGIYLVPELEGLTGLPEIRTTSGVNAGYDGGWTSAQNYDARSITIRGVIANTDVATVERLRRQLTALAGQGKKEELTLDLVTEAGNAYTVQVRTIALEMALQKVVYQQEFMLQLRADDPLIYDASETGHEALLQVAQATGGFTIDFELPLAITGSSEETIVNNEGLEQVPTITRMYGSLHNPKIINQTTNQFMQINADLGFAEGDWIEPSDVVSGKDITINGAPEGAPLSSVQIDGETSQQTYSGKNLLKPYSGLGSISASGLNATLNRDGSITISGTSTAEIYLEFGYQFYGATSRQSSPLYMLDSQKVYTVSSKYSGTISGGSSTPKVYVQYNSSYSEVSANFGSSVNVANSDGVYRSWLRIYNGTTFTNFTIYPQLELGSSATDWQPFVGGIPAPNPDYPQAVQTVTGENVVEISDGQGNEQSYEVNLGKNLFDKDNAPECYFYINGNSLPAYSDRAVSTYMRIEPNTTYTVTKPILSNNRFAIGTCSSEPVAGGTLTKSTQDNNAASLTITSGSNDKYLVIYFKQGAVTTPNSQIFSQIQVEKGSQATSYAAYFTPIELCKIGTYQDYIYKSEDKWYKHKVIGSYIATGDENISIYDSPQIPMIYIPNNEALQGRSNTLLSTHFIYEWGNNIGACYVSGTNNVIACGVDGVTTVDGAKTWLASNKPKFVYILATPTDTEITNEALVAQLEALAAATMYNPQTNIATLYAEGNEQPTLDVSYFTDKNPDTRDELVIDSRLRTITLNGLDVYHLQAPGSEFLMLAPGENRLALQSDITGDNGYAQVSYKQGYLSI